jgi:hypothetical protein
MKDIAVACIATLAVFTSGCKENKAADNPIVVRHDSLLLYEVPVAEKKITGTYTGDFNGSPITITLRYMAGKRISGYDIHKGLRRNISGSIFLEGDQLHLRMQEPGTNPYDGSFDLLLDTASFKIKGKWQPLNNKESGTTRFNLAKQDKDSYWGVFLTDSTGVELDLDGEGACTYSYMVNDSTAAAQKLSFTGSYKFSKDSATITFYWQPNEVFPSRQSVFAVEKKTNEDYGGQTITLKGEGKELEELEMP